MPAPCPSLYSNRSLFRIPTEPNRNLLRTPTKTFFWIQTESCSIFKQNSVQGSNRLFRILTIFFSGFELFQDLNRTLLRIRIQLCSGFRQNPELDFVLNPEQDSVFESWTGSLDVLEINYKALCVSSLDSPIWPIFPNLWSHITQSRKN